MPPPPARIDLVSAAPDAWVQCSVTSVAPCLEASSSQARGGNGSAKRGQSSSQTVSPVRCGGQRESIPRMVQRDAALSLKPTILEEFLQRLSIADRALPTLMMFAGRRKARRTYATISEWRASRGMDHLLGSIATALRDARWRWKLLQSFVTQQDCVSSYSPPRRMQYDVFALKSRMPPAAPRLPRAEELRSFSLETAVEHLAQFQKDTERYLHTVWVPDDEERVPRNVLHVRERSKRRMGALLGLTDHEVDASRLGVARHMRQDALDTADKLLLCRERATSAMLIRPQFKVRVSDREELDPRDRLRRVQRYGWQVREQLFVPSALQTAEALDAKVHTTISALTPRERARSALLEVAPLENIVGRDRIEQSLWETSEESGSFAGGAGSPPRYTTECSRTEDSFSHVLDFSFCKIESMHQLLFVEPRRVGGSAAALERRGRPVAQQTTEALQHSPAAGSATVARRASLRRGRSFLQPQQQKPTNVTQKEEILHKLRLTRVFCDKDDNPVQLEDLAADELERTASPLMRPGGHGSGSRRRSSATSSPLRHGSEVGASLAGSFGALGATSHDAPEPGRLSPRFVAVADKRDLVARKGVARDLLAYLDHPVVGSFLSINHHHEVRPSKEARRFPNLELHELRLNDNQLGVPLTALSSVHRVLREDDGRRGTRNDPDLILWKQLNHLAAEERGEHPGGLRSAQGDGRGVVSGMRFAALFVRCLTAASATETITTLDLSGNSLKAFPSELIIPLAGLRNLKLQRNLIDTFVGLAEMCGLISRTSEKSDPRGGVAAPPVLITAKTYGPNTSKSFPSVRYQLISLALYGNPAQERYGVATYRGVLMAAFPNLRILDAAAITPSEWEELWQSKRTFHI